MFALLGLSSDGRDFSLDYTKHWSDLYRDFAWSSYSLDYLDTSLQLLLRLLEFGPVRRTKDISYPSWVPNWSKSRQRRLPYLGGHYSKNIDTYEPYPSSPGHSKKAMVSFDRGLLRMSWDASVTGLQSHRVAFAAMLSSVQYSEEEQTEQVMEIIGKIFPSIPDARLDIQLLAALLEVVSNFRHPVAEREKTSKHLGKFEDEIHKCHPSLHRTHEWLQTLQSVLRDFCLVELQSSGQNSKTCRGYGIGTDLMEVGDVVISLWSLEDGTSKYESLKSTPKKGIHLSTMLAVRCVGEQPSGVPGDDLSIPLGRIVCPVTCVTLTTGLETVEDILESGRDCAIERVQWSSIRIV
ncbi:hypothetical protein G7046_g3887 [Stylonectria norvegica]|nr:hypothetical protein G7046_g3887 [Stylonectria norvegica]